MHSTLFSIGPLTLHSYGLCMAIGFLAAWNAMKRLCRKTGQDVDCLSSLVFWTMICSIAGARIAYVLEHWTVEFRDAPLYIFRIDQGGLMFYGGFIGAALSLIVYTKLLQKNFFSITDLLVSVLPLGHAFGRLGCFFHGCCHGKPTDAFFGVAFPKGSPAYWEQLSSGLIAQEAEKALPVVPVQLFEAALNLALFILLYRLYPSRHKRVGWVSGLYCIAYGVLRIVTETMRGDVRLSAGDFSIGQFISIAVILTGVIVLLLAKKKTSANNV